MRFDEICRSVSRVIPIFLHVKNVRNHVIACYKNMQSRLSLDLCSHRRWTSSRPTYCFPKRDSSFPEMGYIGPENPIKNLPRLEVQLPLAAVLYARSRSADSTEVYLLTCVPRLFLKDLWLWTSPVLVVEAVSHFADF